MAALVYSLKIYANAIQVRLEAFRLERFVQLLPVFFYFSGITHILLQISGATIFVGMPKRSLMSLLWLVPIILLPSHARKIAAVIGLVLWVFSLVNLGYFCIYAVFMLRSSRKA